MFICYRRWGVVFCLILTVAQSTNSPLAADIFVTEDSATVQLGLSQIDLIDLKRHVNTMASDAMEGREAGSRGGKAALAYLRSELQKQRQRVRLPREDTQEFGREYENMFLLLPGSDEQLKNEVVVVGAHYDHVGYGKPSNSHGPFGQIHNGADDNASGSAALLELIQAFSSLETTPPRSILFVFWDAEEAGLLGSKHWVAHPTIPLKNIRFAINIDMLGRLREGKVVTVGWRSAPGLRAILASHNTGNELKLAFQPRIIADSDHYSFFAAGIPIVHFDTDKHDDYHRPSDDPEKVNWDGLIKLARFAFRVTNDAATRPDFPRFRSDSAREQAPAWMTPHEATAPQVRLGVSWDSELAKRNIAQIAQITSDSPASRAGLRIGDRLVKFGNWENGSIDDLKTMMLVAKSPVPIRLARPGTQELVEASAVLWGSPVRLGGGWIDDPAIPNCVAMTHVIADSPADRAGIAAGDIILEMGGRPIASAEEMRQRVIEEQGPFRFRVERNGRIREAIVDLLDRPTPTTKTIKLR